MRQLPAYRSSPVIRSRDPQVLEPLDIVIDVGGLYDHDKLRYDHHQKGYEEYFYNPQQDKKENVTKLSASGLVYKHYGKEIIQQFYPQLDEETTHTVYFKLYDSLLQALDAIDTGVEAYSEAPLYTDTTGLSRRVSRLNPRWNEVNDQNEKPNPDERFEQAVEICGHDFIDVLTSIVESEIPARNYVKEALQKRFSIDESGAIICFPSGGLPWKSHLYELEREMEIPEAIKFVLYQDESGMWRIQCVTIEGRGFENRLSLPQAWRGLRDADLDQVTGLQGCRFVHAGGFIGGASDYETVLSMAKQALVSE